MIDDDPDLADLLDRVTSTSHRAYRQVDMCEQDGTVVVANLPITGGEITASLGLLGRFTGWLECPALPDLVPKNAYQVTSVGLGYLDCWAGVVLATGAVKKVRVARVYVDSVETNYPDQTVRMNVRGLMNRLTTSLTPDWGNIANTVSVRDEIMAVINVALPWLYDPAVWNSYAGVTDKNFPNNSGWDFGQSRATLVDQWAEYLGAYVYCDRNGNWIMTIDPSEPDPAGLGVSGDNRLIRVTQDMVRDDLVSKVALKFTPAPGTTGSDVYAEAGTDSGVGDVVIAETRTGTPGTSDAADAAETLLARHTAQGRRLTVEIVPHPCLEPGDTIELIYPPGFATYGRLTSELLLIREVTYPWNLDQPMRLVGTAAAPVYGD